ncbi:MAG: lamin tail domain-containing protein [Gammaproteobacteria bacterium]|nr:lamin tail domain-containing protein [Gammaproteobacteria bacterium]
MAQTLINEIRIDQPSTDNDEYFELLGAPGASLAGLTYLVIGDGAGGSGTIEAVVDLSGQSIAGSGLFVAAESTFSLGTADFTTSLNFENSDNVTHLLVSGFSGSNGDDLDTNDDGVLDSTPWTSIDDCVALIESVGSGDQVYCATGNGPDGSFVPAHSYFCPGGWEIGAFDPVAGDDTPGSANTCGDSPPSVVSTTPANGATGVGLGDNIEINFSEDVVVAGAWFDINCGTSGNHPAMVSGGPQSYTLNPDADFVVSEACTVDIFAAQVTDSDSDDPPDNMAADFQFSFDTNPLVVSDLVINEVDYDQSGTDAAEFIEIRNNGGSDVSLAGHSLVLVNGSNDSVYNTINLPPVLLGAGDYFVVCGDAANIFNCDLDVTPNTNLVQNGSPDAVALFAGATLLDTVSYEGDTGAPYTEGSGSGLEDSPSEDFSGISRFPDGTDTNVNNVDFSPRCVTPGAANTADTSGCEDPRPPALRINEIDYDQPGGDAAEFVEIINAGNSSADLTGIELVLVNGSGGGAVIYNTIALPAVSLAPFDYFVVCANAANTANCDLDASPNTNFLQNGAPDAVALVSGSLVLDTVSYEGDTAAPYTEGSGAGLSDSGSSGQDHKGISRFPNGTDTNQNNADLSFACITPGIANTSLDSGCSPNGPVREIFEIQGSGSASPFDGQGVATEDNVVTAVGTDGFFMQTPTARDDADIDTSNGIFVFTGAAPAVAVGDQVDVAGAVNEFFDFTEFALGSTYSVDSSGNPVPAAVTFDDTVPSPDPMAPSCSIEFECYEGMLVEIVDGTVTGPNQGFGSDPIAEVHITAASARTFREPGIEFPGLFGFPEWDGNPEVFELDPDKLGLPNQIIPAGSGFSATGVIGFEFGGYELWPSSLTVTPAPLPVAVRNREIAEMTVGALNLFRLFDDVDNGNSEQVVDPAEYARRLAKFSDYIRNVMDAPDILAVSEVESLAVLQDLADAINLDDATINYAPYLEEGNDVGGIDVGFMVLDTVAVDSVTQLGKNVLHSYDNSLLNDRPPLLLEGRQIADGSDFPIAVIAIHGRSLGGIDTPGPGNGERVRQKRYEQAQFVAQQVQLLQDANPDINLVVIGDFNGFEFTDGYVDVTGFMKGDFDPADNLVCTVFGNLCTDHVNPDLINQMLMINAGERYSFNFRGNAQALDQALTSSGLDELIRDFQIGRGNSDAAVDLINDDSTPLRSSDHDGLVLFLKKDSDGDGVTDDADYCPGTMIPEGAPTQELRTNNFALVDDNRQFDSNDPEGVGPMQSFDIFDTAGCSCEQIVVEAGLGKGHLKFGCSIGEMEAWVDWVNQP